MTIIVPPTRSWGTAALAFSGTLATLVLGFALIFDPAVPPSATPWLSIFVVAFSAATGLVGLKLAHARGGIVLDEVGRRLGLGVTSSRDTWWLALDSLVGLRTVADEKTERWLVVLVSRHRPPIAIAATEERNPIIEITGALAERTKLPVLPEDSGKPPPLGVAQRRFGVRRGAALQGLLAAFGLALVGAAVVTFFQEDRFAAILFGPLLGLIGIVLFVVAIVKRLVHEELVADGERLTHSFVWGRFRWGDKTIAARHPNLRIWLAGMRGAHLEIVGDDRSVIVASGATSKSRVNLDELAAIGESLTSQSPLP